MEYESEITEELLDRIPFPVEVVSGAEAYKKIASHNSKHSNSTAFLIGDEFSVDRFGDQFEDFPGHLQIDTDGLLKSATLENADSFIKRSLIKLASYSEQPIERNTTKVERTDQGIELEVRHNARFGVEDSSFIDGFPRSPRPPNVKPTHQASGNIDILTGQFFSQVAIGYAPVSSSRPWELFAHTKFGGWNECPPPSVHIALSRIWFEKYGARCITHTNDILEFSVENPIRNPDEAIELSKVFYAYCNDIVDQNCGTIDVLAETLLGSTIWFFWWD